MMKVHDERRQSAALGRRDNCQEVQNQYDVKPGRRCTDTIDHLTKLKSLKNQFKKQKLFKTDKIGAKIKAKIKTRPPCFYINIFLK